MPMACRRKDKTTTIRTKEVTMIRIDGARVNTVIRITICRVTERSPGSPASPTSMETFGNVCAARSMADRMTAEKIRETHLRRFFISYMSFRKLRNIHIASCPLRPRA